VFNVAGVLESSPLEPDIDTSALIGYRAGQRYLGYPGLVTASGRAAPRSSTTCARTRPRCGGAGRCSRRPATPGTDEVNVSQPSDALTPRRRGRSVRQPLPRLGSWP